MANVYQKGNGWLVRWREGGRGSKLQAKYLVIEAEALRFKELKDKESAGRKVAKRVLSGPGSRVETSPWARLPPTSPSTRSRRTWRT